MKNQLSKEKRSGTHLNNIIIELFDKCRLIFNKLLYFLDEISFTYIIGIFDGCKYISDKSYFIIILSIIINIIFITLKSGKDSKLKKRFLFGFFIFTGSFICSALLLKIYFEIPIFYNSLFFALIYCLVQAICLANGVTLLIAYIVLTAYEKKHLIKEKKNEQEL